MDFSSFIEGLRGAPPARAYLEGDRDAEIRYLESHAWNFRHTTSQLPESSSPLSLLDIGPTPYTLYLKDRRPDWEVQALDRTPLLAERFAEHDVVLRHVDLDEDALPYEDASFDVVVFTEVLEHVFRPPSELLREIHRILRPGGTLLLSVPNIATLANRLGLLFGRSPLPAADHAFRKEWMHGHGHLHEYTMSEIADLVAANGFVVERRRFVHAGPSDLRQARWASPRFWLRLVYALAQSAVPAWRSVAFVRASRRA